MGFTALIYKKMNTYHHLFLVTTLSESVKTKIKAQTGTA